MLFIFHFGWAKPVQVNPYNFKGISIKQGMMLVSLAGPGMNLLLAFIGMLLIRLLGPYQANEWTWITVQLLQPLVTINIILASLQPHPCTASGRFQDFGRVAAGQRHALHVCPGAIWHADTIALDRYRYGIQDFSAHCRVLYWLAECPGIFDLSLRSAPMPYVVALEAFHGPLDLLLYLIEENQLDIYDIPIATITDQYLAYLADTGDWDLDRLGEFMVMASYLLQLKSRMLLPRRHLPQYEPEEEYSRSQGELVQKLLSYKRFRQVAQYLARLEQGGSRTGLLSPGL